MLRLGEVFRAFFAVVPATVLYDDTIEANAKLLYGQITTMTVYTGTDGRCDATNAQLAQQNGWSEYTVSRYVSALKKAGHIEVRYTPDPKDGHPVRSIYQVIQAPPLIDKKRKEVIDEKSNPSLAKNAMTNVLNNNILPPKSPQRGRRAKSTAEWKPERFEGFWKFYPRGEGRQAAIRAWDRLQPSDELILHIGRALTLQKASPEWQAGIGIPHASTYLNQQRWTDEKREIAEAAPVQAAEPTGAIDTSGLRFV